MDICRCNAFTAADVEIGRPEQCRYTHVKYVKCLSTGLLKPLPAKTLPVLKMVLFRHFGMESS